MEGGTNHGAGQRLAEVAAESRHDQLLKEMLCISDAIDPDQLVQRTGDTLKTIDGETVTSSDGEAITIRNYERLASCYEGLGAPIMAGIVRQAAELERHESMTLEDAYREGLIEPDPENFR